MRRTILGLAVAVCLVGLPAGASHLNSSAVGAGHGVWAVWGNETHEINFFGVEGVTVQESGEDPYNAGAHRAFACVRIVASGRTEVGCGSIKLTADPEMGRGNVFGSIPTNVYAGIPQLDGTWLGTSSAAVDLTVATTGYACGPPAGGSVVVVNATDFWNVFRACESVGTGTGSMISSTLGGISGTHKAELFDGTIASTTTNGDA